MWMYVLCKSVAARVGVFVVFHRIAIKMVYIQCGESSIISEYGWSSWSYREKDILGRQITPDIILSTDTHRHFEIDFDYRKDWIGVKISMK